MTPPEKKVETPIVPTADTPKVDLPVVPSVDAKDVDGDDTTSADLEKIKVNVAYVKTEMATLKTDIAELDKTKSSLSAEVLAVKEKKIEDKETELETKKTETQALIDKMREEQIDANLEWLDATTKATIQKEWAANEVSLKAYETELAEVKVTDKSRLRKQRDGISSKEERKQHTWTNILRATVGLGAVYAWYRALKWIFGRWKKETTSTTATDAASAPTEWFRDHGVGRVLKYAGLWVAWFFGIKWLIKQFSKSDDDKNTGAWAGVTDLLKDTHDGVTSYEKIESAETKTALTNVGDGVNTLYKYVNDFDDTKEVKWAVDTEALWWGKDKYSWVIPHVLDNSFDTMGDLESEVGLFTVWAYGDVTQMEKAFAESLGKWVWAWAWLLINGVMWLFPTFKPVLPTDTKTVVAEKVKTFLTGDNNTDEIHSLFRKIFKTMAYLNYAENAYIWKTVEAWLKAGAILYKKSWDDWEAEEYDATDTEKLQKLIQKIISDPGEYKVGETTVASMRTAEFRGKKIRDVQAMGITEDILLAYNPIIKKNVDDVNVQRKEKIDLLATDQDAALDKMSANAESEMWNSIFRSIANTIPVLHLLEIFGVGTEEEVKKKVMQYGWYKDLLAEYKTEFTKMKTEKDTTKVKEKIDKYYAQLKEVSITAAGLYELQDKDGNRFLHIKTPIYNMLSWYGKMIVTWPVLLVSWAAELVGWVAGGDASQVRDWTKDLLKWAFYTGSGVWAFMLIFTKYKRLWLKLMFAPITYPLKRTGTAITPYVKSNVADMVPRLGKKIYTSVDKLKTGMTRGMSTETALKLYENIAWSNTTELNQNFIKDILKVGNSSTVESTENLAMLSDLIEKKQFGVIDSMIERSRKNIPVISKRIMDLRAGLKNLKPVYAILDKSDITVQKFWYKLLEKTDYTDRLKVQKLLSDPETIKEIQAIENIDDIPSIAAKLGKSVGKMKTMDASEILTCRNAIKNWALKASKSTAEGLTGERAEVQKLVEKDIESVELIKKWLKNKTWGWKILEPVYNARLKSMATFESNISELSAEQVSSFKSLNKLGFKTHHVVELFDIMEKEWTLSGLAENAKLTKILEKDAPTMTEIAEALKVQSEALKLEKTAARQISTELLATVEAVKAKQVLVWAEEIGVLLKTIMRGVAKILRI